MGGTILAAACPPAFSFRKSDIQEFFGNLNSPRNVPDYHENNFSLENISFTFEELDKEIRFNLL